MKKMAILVCIIGICFIGGQAIAGNGSGNGNGNGNGGKAIGPKKYIDICAADEIIIAGTVIETDPCSRDGIKIDAGDAGNDEILTVYGIGPIRYWEDLGIARPATGDNVIIDAREVVFSDESTKIIAISITFVLPDPEENITVELRDENCRPLWRGPHK